MTLRITLTLPAVVNGLFPLFLRELISTGNRVWVDMFDLLSYICAF